MSDHDERVYSRFLVPAIGIGFVALFAILFVVSPHTYRALLTAWMLAPFPHPFIDWQFIPAAAECWSRGINVYVATPCYDLVPTMPHPYSPLWLRFSFLPSSPAGVAAFGIGWAILFWLSQAYLPAPRTRWELRITLLVALSSLTAFALERGNIDIVIFLLALLGCRLWLGSLPLRLLAYAVFLFAGMLKFYPLVLLFLVLRERPRVFLLVTVVTTAILAIAILDVRDELVAVSQNIPTGSYFADLFGAVNLPFGLPVLAADIVSKFSGHSEFIAEYAWIGVPAYIALLLATLFGAASLAFRAGLLVGVVSLEPRLGAVLLVGAALLCGCFFAGQSVGYRGIFLILLLPGLFELRRKLPPFGSRVIEATLYGIAFVSWVLTIEFLSKGLGITPSYSLQTNDFGLLHWVTHELCWWLIITVLLGVLVSFVASSRTGEWARSNLIRPRGGVFAARDGLT